MTTSSKAFRWMLGVTAAGLLACTGCDSGGGGSGVGKQGAGGGFLWKPRSESSGNLVILLPSQYRQRVTAQYVADGGGTILETGTFTTDSHNGNRPHFRYARSGASFGTDVYAVADIEGEGTIHWAIPNGAARTEY
ncbi:MAG: hypothetical protein KBA51_10055 [Kiritimatiellae bacterium]|nr:hypothetical protein [Kiritimatiellia bacterium]